MSFTLYIKYFLCRVGSEKDNEKEMGTKMEKTRAKDRKAKSV